MNILIGLISGSVFGAGLVLSGMIDPQRVIGFLDVSGQWNPALAFVMGGGVAVTTIGYFLIFKKSKPWFGDGFHLPTRQDLDKHLIGGSALFGIGWGMAGLCPGPAITVLTIAGYKGVLFVLMMLLGMYAGRKFQHFNIGLKP